LPYAAGGPSIPALRSDREERREEETAITTFTDHYETLGIAPLATPREIRRARNRLLRIHHPDLNQSDSDGARARTIAIIHAWKVLSDPASRAEYDRMHRRRTSTPNPTPNRRTTGPSAREVCPGCGLPQVIMRNDFCLFCGIGKGVDSATVHKTWLRTERPPDRMELSLRFGCGTLFGATIFGLIALRGVSRLGGGLMVTLVTVVACGLICGVLAMKYGDRFWLFLAD
jgi:molecular chaperone DnaJ